MRFPFRLSSLAWLLLPLGATGVMAWIHLEAAKRVIHVSNLAAEAIQVDANSPTGYRDGIRKMILPEPSADSYQWLLQVEKMTADGTWRLRHVDYDNAPQGRPVLTASPYRWWLAAVAGLDRLTSHRSWPLAIERAALGADPLLHALFVVGAAAVVAWGWGLFPAAIVAAASAAVFPLASVFRSGQPSDHGWALVCVFGSVVAVLWTWRPSGGVRRGVPAEPFRQATGRGGFVWGGVFGAVGLWFNVSVQAPVLLGLALGGLAAAWCGRERADGGGWRWWGISGAAATLLLWLSEFAPDHLAEGTLRTIHPWYAAAWWGLGETVAFVSRTAAGAVGRRWRSYVGAVVAGLVAGVAVWRLISAGGGGVLTEDAWSSRLSRLPNSPVGANLGEAWASGGAMAMKWVALLPLALLVPVTMNLMREDRRMGERAVSAVGLGLAATMMVVTGFRIGAWSTLDAVVLALLGPVIAASCGREGDRWRSRAAWLAGGALMLAASLAVQVPGATDRTVMTEGDVEALVQRDFAHWLANRVRPESGLVLAPPRMTEALIYHGGARGLVTTYWENRDGFNAAVRIAAATSPDEAQGLADNRELTHLVLPSWDPAVREFARIGSLEPEKTLIALLDQWLPPRWLRPVAYPMPAISGFEGRSVTVFEVGPLLDQAEALARLASYFVEREYREAAAAVAATLRQQYPTHLDGLVAQGQVAAALADADAFRRVLEALPLRLDSGAQEDLAWDRGLALAALFAQARQADAAHRHLDACLAEIDETRLRSLTLGDLLRLHRLLRSFGRSIDDPHLRDLSVRLLPVELRERL